MTVPAMFEFKGWIRPQRGPDDVPVADETVQLQIRAITSREASERAIRIVRSWAAGEADESWRPVAWVVQGATPHGVRMIGQGQVVTRRTTAGLAVQSVFHDLSS